MPLQRLTAALGLAAVALLAAALVLFSSLNPGFDPWGDFVSKLGALGQPYAMWWNLVGFVSVGLLLAGFGFFYGRCLGDRWISALLVVFGVGFAATAVPVDLDNDTAGVSKAHVVAICLGLGSYMFALARLTHRRRFEGPIRASANAAATLLALAMVGAAAGLWSMPATHRAVFLVVFGWVTVTSIRLLRAPGAPMASGHGP